MEEIEFFHTVEEKNWKKFLMNEILRENIFTVTLSLINSVIRLVKIYHSDTLSWRSSNKRSLFLWNLKLATYHFRRQSLYGQ